MDAEYRIQDTSTPVPFNASLVPISPLPGFMAPKESASRVTAGAVPLKALIVDDHVDFASSIARLLDLWGHQTQIAADGLAALETAEAFRPDFILVDLKMPGIDGYQVCQRVRATDWGAKAMIAAISGVADEDTQGKRGHEAKFDARLQKPVDLEVLQKLIAQLRN
jgi:CheY-like chemotaxis protein